MFVQKAKNIKHYKLFTNILKNIENSQVCQKLSFCDIHWVPVFDKGLDTRAEEETGNEQVECLKEKSGQARCSFGVVV